MSEKGAHFSLNGENTKHSSKFIKQTMLRTAEECYQTSPQQQKTCFMVVPPIAGDRKPKSFDVGRIWDKRSLGWRPVCVCRFYGHYEPITVLKTAKALKPATLKTVALCFRQIKNYSLWWNDLDRWNTRRQILQDILRGEWKCKTQWRHIFLT